MNAVLIKSLQRALNESGERLTVDGVLGPMTEAAINRYEVKFLLTKKVTTPVVVPPVATTPGVKPATWYPFAIRNAGGIDYVDYGYYHTPSGFPSGVVLHFPATRGAHAPTPQEAEKHALKLIRYLHSQKYSTLSIDAFGRVYQNDAINRWGAHAGTSDWRGIVQKPYTSLNRYFIGLDIPSAGKLTLKDGKFYTWYGEVVPDKWVIFSEKRDSITKGHYEIAPQMAVDAMFGVLTWLCRNCPDMLIDNVVGHEEVTPRKNDPGPVLAGMSCKEIREELAIKLARKEGVSLVADMDEDFSEWGSFNDHIAEEDKELMA